MANDGICNGDFMIFIKNYGFCLMTARFSGKIHESGAILAKNTTAKKGQAADKLRVPIP